MSFEHKGGSIAPTQNRNNWAGVERVVVERIENGNNDIARWDVYLSGVPQLSNYTAGQALTYNAKGTNNPNADNLLTVTSVQGPGYYICQGPWPGQI